MLSQQDDGAYCTEPDILWLQHFLSWMVPPPPRPFENENFSWTTWTFDLPKMVLPPPPHFMFRKMEISHFFMDKFRLGLIYC